MQAPNGCILHSQSVGCVMSPRDAAGLGWPLSEGMQVIHAAACLNSHDHLLLKRQAA